MLVNCKIFNLTVENSGCINLTSRYCWILGIFYIFLILLRLFIIFNIRNWEANFLVYFLIMISLFLFIILKQMFFFYYLCIILSRMIQYISIYVSNTILIIFHTTIYLFICLYRAWMKSFLYFILILIIFLSW